jgi:DNA-directed RNA polymerase specialized sigma24 family protein
MLKRTNPITDERAQWLAAHIIPHEAALRAWLKGKTSLGSDVDDIVQETYAILAAKRTIDAINNPKTYTFRVPTAPSAGQSPVATAPRLGGG